MKKQCPQCKEMFEGSSCECGFSYKTRSDTNARSRGPVLCSYLNGNGKTCLLSGTVSHYIPSDTYDYPPFLCSYHYCLPHSEKPTKQKFTEWLLKTTPNLIDSDKNWIDYYWNKSNGYDAKKP